jgi:predicted nucleic acid-binding protein
LKGTLDSSVVLRFVLNGDSLLKVAESWSWVGASELLFVECHRVMERVRAQGEVTEEQYHQGVAWLHSFLDGVVLIPVGTSIIRRAARPFPVLLKTLDAVHLATLDQVSDGEDPTEWAFLTTDRALGKAARLLRYQVP